MDRRIRFAGNVYPTKKALRDESKLILLRLNGQKVTRADKDWYYLFSLFSLHQRWQEFEPERIYYFSVSMTSMQEPFVVLYYKDRGPEIISWKACVSPSSLRVAKLSVEKSFDPTENINHH